YGFGQLGQSGADGLPLFGQASADGPTQFGVALDGPHQAGGHAGQQLKWPLRRLVQSLPAQYPGALARAALRQFREQARRAAAGLSSQKNQPTQPLARALEQAVKDG